MIAVILCAGFGTRMYPLTRDFPKPLLPVADRPVLDYLMDQIADLLGLKSVHIVSNRKFLGHYEDWRDGCKADGRFKGIGIELHDDGVLANENRLGAAGDLNLVFNRIAGPMPALVSGGDNIYGFSLKPLWDTFIDSENHYVVALPESNPEKLRKTGVLELGENDQVMRLHEKRLHPPFTWFCPPLYFLQPSAWPILETYVDKAENLDAPGYFIDYLSRTETVTAFKLNASRLDIGSIESYREADRILREIIET